MGTKAALTPEIRREAAALYQGGRSARQVSEQLNVSLDAVYYALRRHAVPRRTSREANRLIFAQKPLTYKIKEGLSPQEEQLKLSAVTLYWAEGYKAGKHTVDFANSEPDMVVIFNRFLHEICGVNSKKIRCSVYCYEGQDVAQLTRFWSGLLGIPIQQFSKPYIKTAAPTKRGPRMIHGLVHIRYCDKKLLHQILEWIDEYRQCVGGRVVNCTSL